MLKEEDKKRLQERFQEEASDVYQPFSKELFKQYSVKRGLRNDDGTGVRQDLLLSVRFWVTILMTVKNSYGRSFEIPWL